MKDMERAVIPTPMEMSTKGSSGCDDVVEEYGSDFIEFFGYQGECYEGEWQADRMHGKGRYTYSTGKVYDGMWAEDRPHGEGEAFALFILSSCFTEKVEGRLIDGNNVYEMSYQNGTKLPIRIFRHPQCCQCQVELPESDPLSLITSHPGAEDGRVTQYTGSVTGTTMAPPGPRTPSLGGAAGSRGRVTAPRSDGPGPAGGEH
eukprot:755671-Hanusia_phi.AAC.2